MMYQNDITDGVKSVLNRISEDAFPGVYGYLASLMNADGTISESPYVIANTMLMQDKPKDFPDYLITFITDMFQSEIEAGNDDAMNDLGAQYYEGNRGFEQNFRKAVRYYTMASEAGNRQAQENLGYCYFYGRVGQPDYEKAFHYFALGALDGHLISLYKIGDMYLKGLYVSQNEKEAFSIFIHCTRMMTQEAEPRVAGPVYLRLGNMFLNGIGIEQDLKNALICYQNAEAYLFDMVLAGESMYRRSLDEAIKGHTRVREKLAEHLPDPTYIPDLQRTCKGRSAMMGSSKTKENNMIHLRRR